MIWLLLLVDLSTSLVTTIPGEYPTKSECEAAAAPLREVRHSWEPQVMCVPTPLPQ